MIEYIPVSYFFLMVIFSVEDVKQNLVKVASNWLLENVEQLVFAATEG